MNKRLLPLALGGLGIGTTEFVMMGLLPDIASDFNISIPTAGYMISAYALGVVIGAPLLVAASSRMAPKNILIGLMLMFTVFNVLSAFAPSHTTLFLARLFAGLPHGAFFGVGSVVASRLADKGKEAQAISKMFAGLTIANLLTVPLGTYIGHHYSWRYTFGSIGLIGLLTLAALYFLLPALPKTNNGSIKSELKVFARLEPWLIFLITAIGTGGLFCWISYIAPLMIKVSNFDPATVPYIMMVAGLGMVVGNFVGGKLADHLKPLNACVVLLIAMAVTLVLIYFVSSNQNLSLIMTFIAGSCALAIAAPIQILMIQMTKGAEMLGASVTQAGFNIGNALGAFLGGLPLAAGFGYSSPVLVGVIMAIFGAGFAWVLVIREKAPQEEPLTEFEVSGHKFL
ncbi:MFS transporter [Adhaeribacter aquaticus]|uniref:MFS transporter n=1 Tax=Adhaeribacter aquaticus TaxID=299567 RepID=UPI000428A073|nr:MFS transporter [Adhaeribacter aquaticus]